jgi:GTP-binding protein Era
MNKKLPFRSGFVAVAGRPNVGKSTLVNAYLGQLVAPISPRPQTTRRKQLGILTLPDTQIVFVDTPGLHKQIDQLGSYMNLAAESALDDADLILWLVSADEMPTEEDALISKKLLSLKRSQPVFLVLNKIDRLSPLELADREKLFSPLAPKAEIYHVSALSGTGKDDLLNAVISRLPEGGPYYEEDQITDLYEKEITSDLIRAAVLDSLRDEIPYSVAVRVEEFIDRDDENSSITATLFVERESQKGIVIGKNAEMLKKIGTQARMEIERMTGRKVYLDLRVKVAPNWRNDPGALKRFGYAPEKS